MLWELKLEVWVRHFLQGEPIERIRQEMAATHGGEQLSTPGWRKVKKVVEEFLCLSAAQGMCLPPELRLRWQELGGSGLPQARGVPETRAGVHPATHVEDLLNFKGRLAQDYSLFYVTSPESQGLHTLSSLLGGREAAAEPPAPWEGYPLYHCLRSHAPDHTLWRILDRWRNLYRAYLQEIDTVAREMLRQVMREMVLKRSLGFSLWFCVSLFEGCVRTVSGPTESQQYTMLPAAGRKGDYHLVCGGRRVARGTHEEIRACWDVHAHILSQWAASPDIAEVVKCFNELQTLRQQGLEHLDLLDAKALASGSCAVCQGEEILELPDRQTP